MNNMNKLHSPASKWLLGLTLVSFMSISVMAAEPITLSDEVSSQALEVLESGLGAEDFWPSMHAAEALTGAGHPEDVVTVLTPMLDKIDDDQQRCGVARELVRAGERHHRHVLFSILGSDDPYGHIHACESMYKIGEVHYGNMLRKALANEEKPIQQMMASAALAKAGHPQAMDLVRAKLNDPDVNISRISAWILARLGNEQDIEPVRQAMAKATKPEDRCYFEHALAMLGDPAGKEATLKNLEHTDSFVRRYAAVFAGEAGLVEAQPQLEKMLKDEDVDARIRAAQALFVLSKPHQDIQEIIVRDVFAADEKHPRYSEGSIIQLDNGNLLFANTEFAESTSDFAEAQIVAMESADEGRTWTDRRVLQENIGGKNVMSATLRRLTHVQKEPAAIGLFYLVKNDYNDLKVHLRTSTDEGKTFGEPTVVTDEQKYHVLNNDRVTLLSTGRLIVPVAVSADVKQENHFVCYCYYSDDAGKTWVKGEGTVDAPQRGAMEPEVVELRGGRLAMLMRNQLGFIGISYSEDNGVTWSEHESWNVTAPEAPATIRRIPATGDLVLIWNNNFEEGAGHNGKRTPLTAAISNDEGKTWKHVKNLETSTEHTYSYPSLIFTQGRAVMSYYVHDESTKLYSTRFRSVPVSWFYEDEK
ncbi:Sialidase A precursor [Polystyrenella longa]|uniref:Sialidase A n=1 Tax=Polystyrenella longa TaxID=2528007 RepID=A0A518CI89_9PLAN|nr:exo-alpha-sialidase [Polystyrenella longa]QDU78942.1 Sialidase A precursor [Polystyrenella longa]